MGQIRTPSFTRIQLFEMHADQQSLWKTWAGQPWRRFCIYALLIPSCLLGLFRAKHPCIIPANTYMLSANTGIQGLCSLSLCCYISIQQSVVIFFSFRRAIYLFFPPCFRHLGQDPRSYWGSHKGLVQASSILICFSLNSWSPHLMASCCCNFSVSKAGIHVAWEGTIWENQV